MTIWPQTPAAVPSSTALLVHSLVVHAMSVPCGLPCTYSVTHDATKRADGQVDVRAEDPSGNGQTDTPGHTPVVDAAAGLRHLQNPAVIKRHDINFPVIVAHAAGL